MVIMFFLIFECINIANNRSALTKYSPDSNDTKTQAFIGKITQYRDNLNKISKNMPKKNTLINLHGLSKKLMLQKVISDPDSDNTVYKLKNGQLSFFASINDMQPHAESYKKFCEAVDPYTGTILYVQAPYKINCAQNTFPYTLPDYANANADSFISSINANSLNHLDLRKQISDNYTSEQYKTLFYNGDHHWKIETALWASEYIIEKLGELNPDLKRNIYSPNDFNFTVHPKKFKGSLTDRVGTFYMPSDDFTLIVPNFETNITIQRTIADGSFTKVERTGPFETSVIDSNLFFNTDSGYSAYGQASLLYTVTNNDTSSKGRIMLLGDSYSRPVMAFLSLYYKEILHIDSKYFKEGSKNPYERAIDEEYGSFDAIIVLFYPPSLSIDGFFDFFGND